MLSVYRFFNRVFNRQQTEILMSAKPFVRKPKKTHRSTVIFLHGLGDDGSGWLDTISEIIPDDCKLICPNAPSMPVTVNMGLELPAWYDIKGLVADSEEDEPGIVKSSKYVNELIDGETKIGIPYQKIIIAGFSQGSVITLYTALTSKHKLGGALVLSGYLPLRNEFIAKKRLSEIAKHIPIHMYYGLQDVVIPPDFTESSFKILEQLGLSVTSHSYENMGHSSCPGELADVEHHIKKILGYTK